MVDIGGIVDQYCLNWLFKMHKMTINLISVKVYCVQNLEGFVNYDLSHGNHSVYRRTTMATMPYIIHFCSHINEKQSAPNTLSSTSLNTYFKKIYLIVRIFTSPNKCLQVRGFGLVVKGADWGKKTIRKNKHTNLMWNVYME